MAFGATSSAVSFPFITNWLFFCFCYISVAVPVLVVIPSPFAPPFHTRTSFRFKPLIYFTPLISALAVGSSLTGASPLEKRDAVEVVKNYNAPPGGDVTILNYALTLEFLERKFYQEGLKNCIHQNFIDAGFPDPFYKNLKEVYVDEKACLLLPGIEPQ
jgi:hypothetical protein